MGIGGTINKLLVLSWKFWILRIRSPCTLIMDLFFSLALSYVLIFYRENRELRAEKYYEPFCTDPAKSTDSLPFLCNLKDVNDSKRYLMLGGDDNSTISGQVLYYSPENVEIAKVMSLFKLVFSSVEPKRDSKHLVSAFSLNSNTTFAGIQFDDSYRSITNLKDIKNLQVSIRFPAELRHASERMKDWHTDELYHKNDKRSNRDWDIQTGAYPIFIDEMLRLAPHMGSNVGANVGALGATMVPTLTPTLFHFVHPHFIGRMLLAPMLVPKCGAGHVLAISFTLARDGLVIQADKPDDLKAVITWAQQKDIPSLYMQRFPHSEWYEDPYLHKLPLLVAGVMGLVIANMLIEFVKLISVEKETQLKEALKIMGVSNSLYWTAWFLQGFGYVFIMACIIFLIFLKFVKLPLMAVVVLPASSFFVLLLFVVFYAASTITWAFIFCNIFPTASQATFAFEIHSLIFVVLLTINVGPGTEFVLSLFCTFAFKFGFRIICAYELVNEGSQWSNLFQPASSTDRNTLGYMMLMLIFDTILYLLIALYIEAVFPGENGVAMPWNFPCRPSFWRSKQITETESSLAIKRTKSEFFEPDPKDLKAGVQIRNLRKDFGHKTAVQGLSLNMYEDEITVLLGHNGAGKTTVVSMLTGMITPTSGTAVVNGYDIRRDMKMARKSMGICPQQNIIYNELTVQEHLYFFCRLRGLSRAEAKAETRKYILTLDLKDQRNTRGKRLSGGMKRKLCISIALCGGAKVVMLDEPTSGMDPIARRALWNLLVKHKKGKTMLLTTHFMDEADVLGDRVAIMVQGELKCYGSGFFLKKKYGAGYKLIIAKGPRCDVNKITSLLKPSIPDAQMISNMDSEVTYALPENRVSSFEAMLKQLEAQSNSLGVQSYGIALTTLEEVFMKVGADPSHEEHKSQDASIVTDNIKPSVTGISLIPNQCAAMIFKRYKSMRRSWISWLIHILFPPLATILILLLTSTPVTTHLPALPLTLSDYEAPIVLIENNQGPYYESYKNLIQGESKIVENVNIVDEAFRLTKEAPSTFHSRYIVGASFDSKTLDNQKASSTIGVWFNSNPLHSPGVALGYALNAVFRRISNCSDCSIEFTNEPFPFSEENQIKNVGTVQSELGFYLGLILSVTAGFYILFPIRERKCKSKHQQYAAGVKIPIFWLITLLFDLATYLLICLLVVIVVACFQKDGYKTGEDLCRLLVILFYIALGFLPVVYVFTYIFDIPASGFGNMASLFMFVQLEIVFAAWFDWKDDVTWGDEYDESTAKNVVTTILILLFPHYSFAMAIRETHITYTHRKMCKAKFAMCAEMGVDKEHCLQDKMKDLCQKSEESYYKWEAHGIGEHIVLTCIEGAVLVLILLLVEYGILTAIGHYLYQLVIPRKSKVDKNEDEDVAEERRRIKSMSVTELTTTYDLAVRDLTKYYKSFLAVNSLCVGVKKYECFGLLGLNGAGKTTTFMMMTGDVRMTRGEGWVKGYRLRNQMRKIHKIIGYCPQFDALLNEMTARETIIMFALIKGYWYSDANKLAEGLSENLDFTEHLDKPVKRMSGGNKRKLSAAIALIGDPVVLYFDEPTTGMDPATKYYFRDVVRNIRDKGRCVVLTSHSLEECEALCTRLAIMVNGSFKCLGSVQHLKSKFAKGCTFTIKIKRDADPASSNSIQKYVSDNIPSAQLSETHEDLLTYNVTGTDIPWSRIFGILEGGKRSIGDMEDYSIGQGTLEQVFLSFTKQQKEI